MHIWSSRFHKYLFILLKFEINLYTLRVKNKWWQPPLTLNSSEIHSEHEAVALAVTKQLLESYYTIVRKKIQDFVPKAIMHFLVSTSL